MKGCSKALSVIALAALSGCSNGVGPERIIRVFTSDNPSRAATQLAQSQGRYYAAHPRDLKKDVVGFNRLINRLTNHVHQVWGKNDDLVASQKTFVKYTNNYRTRASINFDEGQVQVETLATVSPKRELQQAIVATLLTPDDPTKVDLFSDKAFILGQGKPFLYKQVLDHDGQPIEWSWRANRYADYLIKYHLKTRQLGYKKIWYVDFPLTRDSLQIREYRYASLIRKYARRYHVQESLVYAIVKTESSFNPYAVSHANAYGLMQVVPTTAGSDVYQRIKKRSGRPTGQQLLRPAFNLDIGTAYLHILKSIYLKDIRNPLSRRYSMISAYNGGAGNVFNTFSSRPSSAIQRINQLSPQAVYRALTKQHPRTESRRYLYKVNKAEQQFINAS
ncbi:membrane-bound lytic murein transglycosylase MltC [Celerinatantimonas yamalensis]|uniref:Membrane-bound lytic murein transglycosylase MltC n=1 Tax=Celerinatantimonas yamalensis TaxID=559956 RepID=A0ABW9G9T1_9GAMM